MDSRIRFGVFVTAMLLLFLLLGFKGIHKPFRCSISLSNAVYVEMVATSSEDNLPLMLNLSSDSKLFLDIIYFY